MTDLSNLGTVKYYKGFLNHAFSLQTINAQKNKDLLFRISEDKKFCFKSYNAEGVAQDLFCIGNANGIESSIPFIANCNVTFNEDLEVLGVSTFKGDTTLSGDLTVEGSTNINTYEETTINGKLTANSSVEVVGNMIVFSESTFENDVTVKGDTFLEGTLSVNGDVTFTDILTVEKDVNVEGILSVNGSVHVTNSLKVYGNVETLKTLTSKHANITENLSVGGEIVVQDELTIKVDAGDAIFTHSDNTTSNVALKQTSSGVTTLSGVTVDIKDGAAKFYTNCIEFNKHTEITKTLSVSGETHLSSGLIVDGIANFNNNVNVDGILTVTGVSLFQDNVTIASGKTLEVLGTSSVDTMITNDATINTLDVTDSATMNSVTIETGSVNNLSIAAMATISRITVENKAEFNSSVDIDGELSVNGNVTLNNNVNLKGTLSIASDSSLIMNSLSEFIFKGPSEANTAGSYADDFSIRESDGTFQLIMSHVENDTVNYSHNVVTINSSAILMNSQHLTLVGHNCVILKTQNTDGVTYIEQNLSVGESTYISDTLTVDGVAVINNYVKIGDIGTVGAVISHKDMFSANCYGFAQNADGTVKLNAPTGKSVNVKNNNGDDVLVVEGNSVTINKLTYINNALSVSGETTINSNLYVSGNLVLDAASTIMSNLDVDGQLTVNGDSTFKEQVTFEGGVFSNKLTTHEGNLVVNNAASFGDTLTVTGKAFLNNTTTISGDVDINNGSLTVSGSVSAGNAEIKTTADDKAVFKHSEADYAALSHNSSGDVEITASTDVSFFIGTNSIMEIKSNKVTINADTDIVGDLTVSTDVSVDGNATIGSMDLKTLNSEIGIGYAGLEFSSLGLIQDYLGNTTVNGQNSVLFKIGGGEKVVVTDNLVDIKTTDTKVQNLNASSDVTVNGKLSVSGTATFESGVTINNALNVKQNTTLNNNLTVNCDSTFKGSVYIQKDLIVDGNVQLNGDLLVQGTHTTVNIESTNVTFDDNAIILSRNSDPASLTGIDYESGIYVNTESVGFVYKSGVSGMNEGWQTKGSDLSIQSGKKLFFSQSTTANIGWSMHLDAAENYTNCPDLVFSYDDGSGAAIKFRITSNCDDDPDEDDDNW